MATGCCTKEVTVICGTKRKFVQVDFGSFAKTMDAIRRKWNLSGEFALQTTAGEKGEIYDIEDDDDLERFKDTPTLIVRPSATDVSFMTSGSMATGVEPGQGYAQSHLPPSYECSILAKPTREILPARRSQESEESAVEIVKIGAVTYSLNEPPPPDSVIVKNEIRNLGPKFEIESIVRKMDIVADCLSMAYYGVVSDGELHKKVQDMQFDVVTLSQILDRTVLQFRTKAGDIIGDLECGFGYLLDGFEDEALESFQAIGSTSEKLKEISEALKERIDEKKQNIEGVLEHVTKKHRDSMSAASEELKSGVADKQMLIERKKQQAEDDTLAAERRCAQLVKMEEEARNMETAATKSASSFSHGFFKMVTFGYYEGDPIVAQQQDKLANIAREDLKHEREELKRYREGEYRASEALNEFTQSLKTTKNTEDIAEKALRGAETGIKSLQASLQSAVSVWDSLHEQCESISNTGNEKLIGKLLKRKTTDERKAFWSSPTFKKQAMMFYARWVALQCICEDFHRGMNRIEQKIHLCIQDNPSVQEAKDKIPGLIQQFERRRQADRAALEAIRSREEAESGEQYVYD